jgi:hypothetical protein
MPLIGRQSSLESRSARTRSIESTDDVGNIVIELEQIWETTMKRRDKARLSED